MDMFASPTSFQHPLNSPGLSPWQVKEEESIQHARFSIICSGRLKRSPNQAKSTPRACQELTDVIDPNHHSPLGTAFSIGDQVELCVHVDRVHAAQLRDLLVSAFLEKFPRRL